VLAIRDSPEIIGDIYIAVRTLVVQLQKPSGPRSWAIWSLKQKEHSGAVFHKQVTNKVKNTYHYMGVE